MIRNVVFDIGQVLLVWDPQLLYREIIPDNLERERFFKDILNWQWRDRSDFQTTVRKNCERKANEHPDQADRILAWNARFFEMMTGPVPGAWDLVAELQTRGLHVYAIANFAADKYAESMIKFPFLNCLDGMLVSSEVGFKKPDARIYAAFLSKFSLHAEECVFVDDDIENVEGAKSVGMNGFHYVSIEETRWQLERMGILPRRASPFVALPKGGASPH